MNSLKTLSALFVLLFVAVANAVPNVKISELPTATTITTNDLTVLVSSGSTRKASLGSVLDTLRPVGAFVANTDSTAVGISANGSSSGAALGNNANGSGYGAAVGYNANGSDIGAALGNNANGSGYGAAVGNSADGSGSGAALGDSAKGYYLGAAVGMSANGTNYGVAVGRGADGHGVGNVAIGGNDAGTNNARVPEGFTDTIELGRGTATTDGGLHFRGRLIVDSNYVHYGNGSGLTNVFFMQEVGSVGNTGTSSLSTLSYGTNEAIATWPAFTSTSPVLTEWYPVTNTLNSVITEPQKIKPPNPMFEVVNGCQLKYTNTTVRFVNFAATLNFRQTNSTSSSREIRFRLVKISNQGTDPSFIEYPITRSTVKITANNNTAASVSFNSVAAVAPGERLMFQAAMGAISSVIVHDCNITATTVN